jgi:hypothetical protein
MLTIKVRAIRFLVLWALLLNGTIGNGQIVLEIPATRTKPAISCPPEGKVRAGSRRQFYEELNRLKNRNTVPTSRNFDNSITLVDLLGDGVPDETNFSSTKAANIQGYIVYVSPSGWGETCNCGTAISDYSDIHVEIAEDPDEEKGGRTLVVEFTPRTRFRDATITRRALKDLWESQTPVQVSGWLFYDKEHERQSRNVVGEDCERWQNRRQTCWELHPATKIETVADLKATSSEILFDPVSKVPMPENQSVEHVDNGPSFFSQLCACDFFAKLIWPVTVVFLAIFFRKGILSLLTNIGPRLKRIKFGWFEAELNDLYNEVTKMTRGMPRDFSLLKYFEAFESRKKEKNLKVIAVEITERVRRAWALRQAWQRESNKSQNNESREYEVNLQVVRYLRLSERLRSDEPDDHQLNLYIFVGGMLEEILLEHQQYGL